MCVSGRVMGVCVSSCDWVLNTADGAYYQPLATPTTLTFAADSKTYKYTIEWDQSNTRWLAYEVHGEVGAYYRSRVNNNDVNDFFVNSAASATRFFLT